MKDILIVWREIHAGEQFDALFGADWREVLREIHAGRLCDCCTPVAFAPNGAKAWVENDEVVLGKGWEE